MKKIIFYLMSVVALIAMTLPTVSPPPVRAAWEWPNCNFHCNAEDVRSERVWLGDYSGTEFDPGSCNPGDTLEAYIWFEFYNNAGSPRYALILLADIYINDAPYDSLDQCVLDSLAEKTTSQVRVYSLNWTCGDVITIDLVLSWETGGGANCTDADRSCGNRGTKCYAAEQILVEAPLVADFEFNTVCFCNNTTFTETTTGGKEPYTYSWDFDDSDGIGTDSTAKNPSYHYDAPDTYTVTLTVTDSDSHSDIQNHNVTVYDGPTAAFSANVRNCCAPLSVSFSDNSTAGDNPIDTWYWEFGDGCTSTDENPSHTYNDGGTYNVTLTLTDEHGCTDSKTEENYITANEGPAAAFSANATSCCDPLAVQFTDLSTAGDNPIDTWYWEFGDGTNSTEQHPIHIYTTGTYNVTLTVTDEHGCSDTETKTGYITANEGPTADFSANVIDCCAPLSVNFTDESTKGSNNITEWSWDFGDGGTSTDENPSHTYTEAGTYNVTLTVTDEHGCSDSETKEDYMTANEGPTADFSANATSCCDPLAVQFTDLSTDGDNPIDTWYWDFGDGTNSTEQHPIHIYTTGTYNVTLTVTDEHGCSDTRTEENYITANDGPTAAFSANVTNCCAPLSVSFSDNSTAGDNPIDTWYWEFGDGSTSNLTNPSHTYVAGIYNVTLTVTDEHGCSDSKTEENYITANEGPTADFSSNVTNCCAPLSVNFTDESIKGSNNITEWNWDFGDGNTSEEQNPSHTYTVSGTYNVTLTVTDSHGCNDNETKEKYITANEGPTADFVADVTNCCAPLSVNFTDESIKGSNNITGWYWDFGDGTNSILQNPSHTYNDGGTYNVTLTVTDSHGCSDTKTEANYIKSNEGPTAAFSAIPSNGYAPLEVNLTDNSVVGDNPIDTWAWDFGDGDTSTSQNPSHTYNNVGTYTVTLTVIDKHGCIDDASTNVVVTVPPPPPRRGGGGGCPTTKYLTVDWEGNNTTEPLYSNDKLAVDLLGPSSDLSHNLFLEQGTHAPVVYKTTHYLIIVRELEEIPSLPENTEAIVVFNITPVDAVFNRDIFLTLGVDQLPENALNVTMAYYDDVNGVWMLLESEVGGPSGVAELTLSAPINHFSIFGVLAELAPTPPQPAHFVPSGLSIKPSVEKIWESVTFVTKTGESVTITANVLNDGGQEGTYTVELKLNGETVDTEIVTLGAGQSQPVSFTVSGLDYGQYEVEVAGLSDEFTASRTITWWLIIVIIVAIGLIIWGVVWGRRRRKAHQEA